MNLYLRGKRALVTGGSKGIGLATAALGKPDSFLPTQT
jgi:short-subunit dehydrogenase